MQASMIAWVVTYVLHSTILVLGAWLLERRWSDRPERMSAVWKTALVGGLVTATVQTGLGITPAAGRWELSSELASAGEPEPENLEPVLPAGAEAVAAPAGELVAAVEPARVPSWPPPDRRVTASSDDVHARGPVVSGAVAERTVEPVVVDAQAGNDARAQDRDTARGLAAASVIEPASSPATGPSSPPTAESSSPPAAESSSPPAAGSSAPVAESSPAIASSSSPAIAWSTVVPWLLALALVGSGLGLLSVLLAFGALRRQLRGRRALSEGSLAALLEGLRRRAGLGRPVPLTVAPRVRVPMAVGVLWPEIVVPPQAAHGLPVAHQESLLAHELAHVLRRDPAWRLVALLVERVFFFQPLNRLASRRLAQSAEYLCDDWAARHTHQPLALASCLTEIATWVARPGPVAATMAGPRSILGRRVQRLLQPAPASTRPWWLGAALGLPLLALVAMAPGVDARAAKPPRRSDRGGPARVVVIDHEGRRHELEAPQGGAVVVEDRDGMLHVKSLDDAREADRDETKGRSRRDERKAARQQERANDKARRQARKELRQAFREAKRRGDPAPSRREVEAILRRARRADADTHAHARSHGHPEHVEVHVVVPGELAVHGRMPLDLEGLEQLEGLEALGAVLEQLEALEELGPVLEELERELEESGLDVVIRRQPGAADPQLRIMVPPDDAQVRRWRAQAERARREAERARREAERARREAERVRRREAPASDMPTVMNHRRFPSAPAAPAAVPAVRGVPAAPAPPSPPAFGRRGRTPAPAVPPAPPPAPSPGERGR